MSHVIGLMPSSFTGPRPVSRRTSKFNRKLLKSSPGAEVYLLGGTAGHMSLLRDFCAPFESVGPGTVGLGDCESLFTDLKTK